MKIVGLFFKFAFLAFLLSGCNGKDSNPVPDPSPQKPVFPYYMESSYKEPVDNPSTKEGVALGKALFFEKALSLDRTISCASCHQPGKGFSNGEKVGTGIQNIRGKRNVPGLWNVGFQKLFFWDGRSKSLEEQSLHPIQDPGEMGLSLSEALSRIKSIPTYKSLFQKAFGSEEITIEKMARAIAQFERSLTAFQSKYDRYLQGTYSPTELEQKGIKLFFTHPDPFAGLGGIRGANCGDCHLANTLMGRQDEYFGFHNTGLSRLGSFEEGLKSITGLEADFGKFKAPPLRNIELTAPYMHDGRFKSLEEVIDHYNSDTLFSQPNLDVLIQQGTNQRFGSSLALRDDEKKALLAFLKMLTDSTTTFQP